MDLWRNVRWQADGERSASGSVARRSHSNSSKVTVPSSSRVTRTPHTRPSPMTHHVLFVSVARLSWSRGVMSLGSVVGAMGSRVLSGRGLSGRSREAVGSTASHAHRPPASPTDSVAVAVQRRGVSAHQCRGDEHRLGNKVLCCLSRCGAAVHSAVRTSAAPPRSAPRRHGHGRRRLSCSCGAAAAVRGGRHARRQCSRGHEHNDTR